MAHILNVSSIDAAGRVADIPPEKKRRILLGSKAHIWSKEEYRRKDSKGEIYDSLANKIWSKTLSQEKLEELYAQELQNVAVVKPVSKKTTPKELEDRKQRVLEGRKRWLKDNRDKFRRSKFDPDDALLFKIAELEKYEGAYVNPDFWDWRNPGSLITKVQVMYDRLLFKRMPPEPYISAYAKATEASLATRRPIIDPFASFAEPNLPLPAEQRDRFLTDHSAEIREIEPVDYGLLPAELDFQEEIFHSLTKFEDLWRGNTFAILVKLKADYERLVSEELHRRTEEIKNFSDMLDPLFNTHAKNLRDNAIEVDSWIYLHLIFVNEIWRARYAQKVLDLKTNYVLLLIELELRHNQLLTFEREIIRAFPKESKYQNYHDAHRNFYLQLIYVNDLWPQQNRQGVVSLHYLATLRYREFIRKNMKRERLTFSGENHLINLAQQVDLDLESPKALEFFQKAYRKETLKNRRTILSSNWSDVRTRIRAHNETLLGKDPKLEIYHSLGKDDQLFDNLRGQMADEVIFAAYLILLRS